jgi:adenylate cyclase
MKMWHTLVTLALLIILRILDPFLLESSRLSFFDYLQRSQEPVVSEQIVLIDIDEDTLAELGQYPIPRDVMADEIIKLQESIVAFNILFSEKDRFGGDAKFADTLFGMNSIVAIAPSNRTNTLSRPRSIGVATFGERDAIEFRPQLEGMLFAQPSIMDAAIGYGTIASANDVDGIIRRAPLLENFEGKMYPGFALDILRVAAGDISYQISTDDYGIQFVRIPKFDSVKTDSRGNVNIAFWNEFKRYSFTELDKVPAGSIAIVGTTFEGSTVVSTPLGAMYPHDVQANLLKTMISGIVIKDYQNLFFMNYWLTFYITFDTYSALSKISIVISGIGFIILSSGACIPHYICSILHICPFDPVFLVISLVLVFAHGSFVQFYTNFKQKQQIKGQFGTYLSPDMVEMLVKDPSLMKLGGERKEMTFLFMDICGFTPISEHYKNNDDPEGWLN